MKKWIILIMSSIILIELISLIASGSLGGTLKEFYSPAANDYYLISSTRSGGQSFTVGTVGLNETYVLYGVSFNFTYITLCDALYKLGIYNIDPATGLATGSYLSYNDTINMTILIDQSSKTNMSKAVNISLPPVTLYRGQKYAIIMNNTGTKGELRYHSRLPGLYTGGELLDNGTGVWRNSTGDDAQFRIYGTTGNSTCTYLNSTDNSGNWMMNWSSNCTIDTFTNLNNANFITFGGYGTVTLNAGLRYHNRILTCDFPPCSFILNPMLQQV